LDLRESRGDALEIDVDLAVRIESDRDFARTLSRIRLDESCPGDGRDRLFDRARDIALDLLGCGFTVLCDDDNTSECDGRIDRLG